MDTNEKFVKTQKSLSLFAGIVIGQAVISQGRKALLQQRDGSLWGGLLHLLQQLRGSGVFRFLKIHPGAQQAPLGIFPVLAGIQ